MEGFLLLVFCGIPLILATSSLALHATLCPHYWIL